MDRLPFKSAIQQLVKIILNTFLAWHGYRWCPLPEFHRCFFFRLPNQLHDHYAYSCISIRDAEAEAEAVIQAATSAFAVGWILMKLTTFWRERKRKRCFRVPGFHPVDSFLSAILFLFGHLAHLISHFYPKSTVTLSDAGLRLWCILCRPWDSFCVP